MKKNELKPWLVERFCIPPEQNAAFVHAMEDVLEVYRRPEDPGCPQVCIDETSKQLVEHTRTPIAATIGRLLREDDEYKRCGTANVFLCVEPLTGRTVIKATERRTAIDFAHFRATSETRCHSEVGHPIQARLRACIRICREPSTHLVAP